MVYNTTDNRSSLSITDLSSDGEYSVTVAGRDGAGRLRQESDELKFDLRDSTQQILFSTEEKHNYEVESKLLYNFNQLQIIIFTTESVMY